MKDKKDTVLKEAAEQDFAPLVLDPMLSMIFDSQQFKTLITSPDIIVSYKHYEKSIRREKAQRRTSNTETQRGRSSTNKTTHKTNSSISKRGISIAQKVEALERQGNEYKENYIDPKMVREIENILDKQMRSNKEIVLLLDQKFKDS